MSDSDRSRTPAPLPASTLFCEGLGDAGPGDTVSLASQEVAHARVLRLTAGEPVLITDGRSRRWVAELTRTGRHDVACRLLESRPAPPPWPVSLWAPVGNRERSLWLVEKAVELGAASIRFVELERSRSVTDAGRSPGFLERARRRAIGALTQSGGAVLPRLIGPQELDEALETREGGETAWLADPEGAPFHDVVGSAAWDGAIWMVGPEGGLSAGEGRRVREAGFGMVSLGPRTLRFETAAVAGLASVAAALYARARRPAARDGRPGSDGRPEPWSAT